MISKKIFCFERIEKSYRWVSLNERPGNNGIDENSVYEEAYQIAKDNFEYAVENGYTDHDNKSDFASEHWDYFEDSVDEDKCKCHICGGKGYLDWIDNAMKRMENES